MGEIERIVSLPSAPRDKSYLFYGGFGAGKTTMATRTPGRGLFIDMDQKLAEMDSISPADRERISVWTPGVPIGDPEEIHIPYSPDPKQIQVGAQFKHEPQGYKKTVAVINELLHKVRAEQKFPYDWICLDSLTSMADHWEKLMMFSHKITFIGERQWGIFLNGLREFISTFLLFPCTRIVIAHDKAMTDDDGKLVRIRPAVAGQMGDNLGRMFSEVYYFHGRERGSGKYMIQTVKDSLIAARTSRTDLKPDEEARSDLMK